MLESSVYLFLTFSRSIPLLLEYEDFSFAKKKNDVERAH